MSQLHAKLDHDQSSVELATLEWVSWFNHHRLLEPIGYIPPAEAEANTTGNSPTRPPSWPDLNQPASTEPGAIQGGHRVVPSIFLSSAVFSRTNAGVWGNGGTHAGNLSVKIERLFFLAPRKEGELLVAVDASKGVPRLASDFGANPTLLNDASPMFQDQFPQGKHRTAVLKTVQGHACAGVLLDK